MSKNHYILKLEKQASATNKALSFVNKHKGAIIGGGLTATALGGAYALGDDDTKQTIHKIKDSIVTGYTNGTAQDMLRDAGGLAGLAISMKKGNSIGKAVTKGAIPGMAIGDLAGAATIPTYQLYKKHKKEFGTAPDMKTTGKLLAANVVPTASVWGGLYGAKKALRSGKLNPRVVPESANKLSHGAINLGNKLKKNTTSVAQIDHALGGNVSKVVNKMKDFKIDFDYMYNNPELLDRLGSQGIKDRVYDHTKEVFKALGGVGGTLAPLALAQEASAVPSYIVTPQNLIDAKKQKIKQQQLEGNDG